MDKLKEIPKEVCISAIMYRITEAEGAIIFSELYGMCFRGDRIIFTHPKYALWQVQIIPAFGDSISVCHIQKMFELVQQWYGDDFGRPIKNE